MGDGVANPESAAGPIQPCPKGNVAPCQGQGMSSQAQVDYFSAGFASLQKKWSGLSAEQRIGEIQTLVDSQAVKNGFPAPMVETPSDLGRRNGEFRSDDWIIAINPRLVESNTLNSKQAALLGDTIYHETRHAEQWSLMVRRQAAEGFRPEEIESGLGIQIEAAIEAARQPLLTSDSRRACADALHKSVYGADRQAREATLENLREQGSGAAAATAKYKKVKAEQEYWKAQLDSARNAYSDRKLMLPPATKMELDSLIAHYNQMSGKFIAAQARTEEFATKENSIYQLYQKTYADYRALPEEADAWNAGGRAASGIMNILQFNSGSN